MAHIIKDIFIQLLSNLDEREDAYEKTKDFEHQDWDNLLAFALKERLFPAIQSSISKPRLDFIPPDFSAKINKLYLLNLKRNAIQEKEVLNIIQHLKLSGIPAIFLKGPILARLLYGDIALRQASCDIDVLIKAGDVLKAEDALKKIGYSFDAESSSANYFHKFNKEITLSRVNEDGRYSYLDLHWSLRERFFPGSYLKEFWQGTKEQGLGGYEVLMPSYEDLLLSAALTAIFDDGFPQIGYLFEFHCAVSKFNKVLDWERIIEKSQRFKLNTVLFFALRLSQGLFHTEVPKQILVSMRVSFLKRHLLGLWLTRANVLNYGEKIAKSYVWKYIISTLLYTDTFWGYLKTVFKRVFLPMDEVMAIYGKPLNNVSYSQYLRRLFKPILDGFYAKRI